MSIDSRSPRALPLNQNRQTQRKTAAQFNDDVKKVVEYQEAMFAKNRENSIGQKDRFSSIRAALSDIDRAVASTGRRRKDNAS